MPLKRCKKNGVSGWSWGDSGACYTGPNGKQRALKQGLAENDGDEAKFKKELAKSGLATTAEADAVIEEIATAKASLGSPYLDAVKAYISKKERDSISEEDFAWPEKKKYPIRTQEELDAAAKLIGRAPKDKQASIKKRAISIAKRRGLTLPESWTK